MPSYHAPQDWKQWLDWLIAGLHGRSRRRLAVLLMGLVFAGGRRVVAASIRAAGLSDDDRLDYDFLQSVGREWEKRGRRVLVLALRQVLRDQPRVLIARDDSPWDDATRRPSHADRRKALQATWLAEEFSAALPAGPPPRKIRDPFRRLPRIAVRVDKSRKVQLTANQPKNAQLQNATARASSARSSSP
jgi:hypothetical protein